MGLRRDSIGFSPFSLLCLFGGIYMCCAGVDGVMCFLITRRGLIIYISAYYVCGGEGFWCHIHIICDQYIHWDLKWGVKHAYVFHWDQGGKVKVLG